MARTSIVSIPILAIFILGLVSTSMVTFCVPLRENSVCEDDSVVTIGTTDAVEYSLDIAQAYDVFAWDIISCLSSGLVEVQPGSVAGSEDILPALAESWNVSDDGKVWDFSLREGVVFESGAPFNASVAKYTFDRNCNLTGEGLFEIDGPQLNIGYDAIIDSVAVVTESVVRFYLKIPFAPFLQLLSIPPSYIVDPMYAPMNEVVLYSAGNPRGSHPCGLGPFLLESWSRVGGTDTEISLVPNPDYWDAGSGEPKVDRIVIVFYSSATALATAMATNEIDIAFRRLAPAQLEAFKANTAVRVWDGVGAQIQYLCFNQNFYPLNVTEIRQGVAAALNRTNVCETVFLGHFQPLWSMIPSGLAFHEDAFGIYGSANYTYTRDMLDNYGYNEANKLVIELWYETSGHYPQSTDQALVYKSDLEASGVITVNLHNADWSTYVGLRRAGSMPVFIYGWYPDYPDADDYAFLPFSSWLNLGYDQTYPQGGIDQYNLWLEGRSAMTDMTRAAAYHGLQELQAQECSVIPLWQAKQFAVTDLEMDGVYLDITGLLRYWLLDTTPTTSTSTTTTTTTTTTSTSTTTTTTTTTTSTSTTTTTTPISSSTTSTTTSTDGLGIPTETLTIIVSLSSAAVIIVVAILFIRSKRGP